MTRWSPARWAVIKELFLEIVALSPERRQRALADHQSRDPEAATEVQRLLAAVDGTRLDAGAASFVPGLGGEATAGAMPSVGSVVGPFELVRLIGMGGMGVVYEGKRLLGDGPARVAVKVLGATRDDAVFAQRMASERRLLEQLDHPGIARVVDGGTLETTIPWFAMAYIDGEPIDAWCTARTLGASARVALLAGACAAVQHAHDRHVLHRDLKPANILVTTAGEPVLVDFGIARLLDEDVPGTLTRAGYRPLSLAYASPEHRSGAALTPASDVYSLGATTWRLLTGRSPAVRVVPPSQALDETAAAALGAASLSDARDAVAPWDDVVVRALSHDPLQRFPTPAVFAAALRRAMPSP